MSGAASVLVIKLGALGDLIQATGPFAAIRHHHGDAHIVLLTAPPFADFAAAGGWFDAVWADSRPAALDIAGWLGLRRRLLGGGFGRVYDLQTSSRSGLYRRLFWPRPAPEWSGIARGCSHPHANPRRDFMHTLDRQAEQLAMAGIAEVPAPDIGAVDADISAFGLPGRFALLVPGGAPHRPAKRWPAARFAELARWFLAQDIQPVLIGTPADGAGISAIKGACPEAIDLSGRTSLTQLAALARRARAAVGNDTGPMHLFSVAGCPSLVLYSQASDPALCGQRGRQVTILQRAALADLTVAEVTAAINQAAA